MGGPDGLEVEEGLLSFCEDNFHFSFGVDLAGGDEFVQLLFDRMLSVESLYLDGADGANLGLRGDWWGLRLWWVRLASSKDEGGGEREEQLHHLRKACFLHHCHFSSVMFFSVGMSSVRQPHAFGRWLYRNYRQGSSVSAFIGRRVHPAAWILIGGCGASSLMGANLSRSIVVVLTLLAFSLLCVGFLWAFLRRACVSVIRELPTTVAVGEELAYELSVRNEGRWGLHDAFLRETGDDPRPTEWEFTNLKEPDEEDRNFFDRTFAFYRWKWLNERGGSWQSLGKSAALALDPGGVQRVTLSLMPLRRGLLRLNDLRVELPDPLGLFQRCRAILNEEDEVLVIPKRYRLPNLDLGGQSERKMGGEEASTTRGTGDEFMGLREYRAGDSLRKIHWKAWARTGQPIVKEFEEVRFPRYGLVLDTSLNEGGPKLLEEAISVAASFVSTVDGENSLLDLMFVKDEPAVFTAGRGAARTDRLMEVLARVEGSDTGSYDSLCGLVLRHAAEMTACVVVLSSWCAERKGLVDRLRSAGLEVLIYVIGVGEAPDDESLAGVHWVRVEQVQEDLLKG